MSAECGGRCYSLTESGAGWIDPDCPKHGNAAPRMCDVCKTERWTVKNGLCLECRVVARCEG